MRSNAELADALASFAQDSMLAPEDRETVTQAAAALRKAAAEDAKRARSAEEWRVIRERAMLAAAPSPEGE